MNKKNNGQTFLGEVARHPKGMPPLDVIRSEVTRLGLTVEDADAIIDHWLANGFRTGRHKVQSWTAVLRTWQRQKWFPSQKYSKDLCEEERQRMATELKELRKRYGDDSERKLF